MEQKQNIGEVETQVQRSPATGWLPELRAGLSGLLLWASFPPQSYWWLAWFALIPLFGNWVDHPDLRLKRHMRVALLGGLCFWLPAIQWVRLSDPSAWPGWLVMSLVLAVWWPFMAAMTYAIHRRNGWPLLPTWIFVWGAQEIGREYYMTGFPWYHLAHTQFRQVWLIQSGDLLGASSLSLLMVAVQVLIAQWFFGSRFSWTAATAGWRRGVRISAASLVVLIIYGQVRINTAQFTKGPTVALLQSDVPQSRRLNPDHNDLIEVYRRLIQKTLDSRKKVDLIVWPETSFPYPLIVVEPSLDEATTKKVLLEHVPDTSVEDWYKNRNEAQGMMKEWSSQAGAPILVGATAWDLSQSGFRKYNTAALFDAQLPPQYYYKMHLVPFGEYIPWIDYVPQIADLAPFPPDQRPNLKHGAKPTVLTLNKTWRMAPLICFEDTVPHVVRRFFSARKTSDGVDFLLNISNDGWFRNSEEHEIHLAASIFRCVETRTPMLRSVNTGISAVIDSNGRIVSEVPVAREDVLIETVPLSTRFSLYRTCGDITGLSSLLVCLVGLVRRRRN